MKTFQQTLNLLNRRLNARNAIMMHPIAPTLRLPRRTASKTRTNAFNRVRENAILATAPWDVAC